MNDKQVNIVVVSPGTPAREAGDNFQEQAGRGSIKRISVDKLKSSFAELKDGLEGLVDAAKNLPMAAKPESVKIGLALSAEGSIGIVTGGAEISVELTFRL